MELVCPNCKTIVGEFKSTDCLILPADTAIWNPNAAVFWSFILSPTFGIYLQMKNWQTLGQARKILFSKIWLCFSLACLPIAFTDYWFVAWGIFIAVWYFVFAKSQGRFVRQYLSAGYKRKSWWMPILIGFTLNSLFWAILLHFHGLIETPSINEYKHLPPQRNSGVYNAKLETDGLLLSAKSCQVV